MQLCFLGKINANEEEHLEFIEWQRKEMGEEKIEK